MSAGLVFSYLFGFLAGTGGCVALMYFVYQRTKFQKLPKDAARLKNEAYQITRTPSEGIIKEIIPMPNNKLKFIYQAQYKNEEPKLYEIIWDKFFTRHIYRENQRDEWLILPKEPADYNKALFDTDYGQALGKESIYLRKDKTLFQTAMDAMKEQERVILQNKLGMREQLSDEEIKKAFELLGKISSFESHRSSA